MFRLNSIKVRNNLSDENILHLAINKYHVNLNDIINWRISKKSIDARRKDDVHFLYSVDIEVKDENKYPKLIKNKIKEFDFPNIVVSNSFDYRPIIVGCGPSGIFAALTFVQNGVKPIIIEQGQPIEDRKKTVDIFLSDGKLNTFSNVQFGEGGAGTFSDGKLTTNLNSPFCKKVLETFVEFGAPEEILYLAKPHIGTDKLITTIKNIREYIISKGGTFLFNSKVEDFKIKNSKISSVIYRSLIDDKIFELNTDNLILAIGHSARDTFEKLYEKNFSMEKKNFSVGVRIEHLQNMINLSQYGNKTKLKLPPAEYKFAYHSNSGRSCYTFCMCPGGIVMPSSSEKNTIVTNGMSYFLRDGINANSAILVNVTPDDFKDSSPLAGIYFQKDLEQKAFILGGSNYFAPIQRFEDFKNNKKSEFIGKVAPTYLPGTTLSNLKEILPSFVSTTICEGISYFDTKLKGFADPDSILTGVETRSSSPVRILRNENFVSNINGVYPCGEGAGYAGGIMTAAVDGIKCALAILSS